MPILWRVHRVITLSPKIIGCLYDVLSPFQSILIGDATFIFLFNIDRWDPNNMLTRLRFRSHELSAYFLVPPLRYLDLSFSSWSGHKIDATRQCIRFRHKYRTLLYWINAIVAIALVWEHLISVLHSLQNCATRVSRSESFAVQHMHPFGSSIKWMILLSSVSQRNPCSRG